MAAEKVEGEVMSSVKKAISISRIYTVPLTRAWISPKQRRAKRAINLIREFAVRHMKSSEVRIEEGLNEVIWRRGIERPPRRITVKMEKGEDGIVTVSHLPTEKRTAVIEPTQPSKTEKHDEVTDSEDIPADSSSLEEANSG